MIFLVLFASSQASSEIGNQTKFPRIASGFDLKKGENSDFCYLTANFIEKQKTCGCFLRGNNQVVTSARCVYE